MNETTAMVVVAIIGALGSILTVMLARLTRKGLDLIDTKTRWLDAGTSQARKDELKSRIVEVVTLAARATTQTFVDDLKAKAADGKLTKDEAAEAFQRTMRKTLRVLTAEGFVVGREVLDVAIEAVVGKLKTEKNAARDAAKPE